MRAMKHALPVLAAALVLSACGSNPDRAPTFRGGAGGDAAYGRGLQALESGETEQAYEYFACAAQFGGGYEVAWYYAGTTALTLASQGGPDAATYLEDGEHYLERSGNAGWGASQAALAEHFHAQGNATDAYYWTLMYTNNVREISLGLTRMDSDTIEAISNAASDEDITSAQQRVARFVPDPIPLGRPSEECNEAIRGDRERQPRERNQIVRPQRTGPPGSRRPGSPY
jgi:hypothetical protein